MPSFDRLCGMALAVQQTLYLTGWMCLIALETDAVVQCNHRSVYFTREDYIAYAFIMVHLIAHSAAGSIALDTAVRALSRLYRAPSTSERHATMAWVIEMQVSILAVTFFLLLLPAVGSMVLLFDYADNIHQALVNCLYAETACFFCALCVFCISCLVMRVQQP